MHVPQIPKGISTKLSQNSQHVIISQGKHKDEQKKKTTQSSILRHNWTSKERSTGAVDG